MPLWRRKQPIYPKITIAGIDIHCNPENPEWSFTYKEIDFITESSHFILPSFQELDAILKDVEALNHEMFNRCQTFMKEYGDTSDGELLSVHLDSFADKKTIEVSWCSVDESWGDMGVDFIIKNGIIESEQWGD